MEETIASLCFEKYSSLGKNGKPRKDEWTSLAGILVEETSPSLLKVVSLATGTKCIGPSKMSSLGYTLHDSHAEVLARRGLLRYLYEQIEFLKAGKKCDVFSYMENGLAVLKDSIKFHFYCSHVPCGDASIIVKAKRDRETDDEIKSIKRMKKDIDLEEVVKTMGESGTDDAHSIGGNCTADDLSQFVNTVGSGDVYRAVLECASDDLGEVVQSVGGADVHNKVVKYVSDDLEGIVQTVGGADEHSTVVNCISDDLGEVVQSVFGADDVHRTGAKCVADDKRQDAKLPGLLYHKIGAVRTKPGRGEPTLSVSCSDKLARWLYVGLQGSLLSQLIQGEVRLSSVTVGGWPFDVHCLKRALVGRSGFLGPVLLLHSSLPFVSARESLTPTARPASSAIIWCLVSYKPLEVAVEGRKLGSTKKISSSSALMISRSQLFKTFQTLASDCNQKLTYKQAKQQAVSYNLKSMEFKNKLGAWSNKPALMDFTT